MNGGDRLIDDLAGAVLDGAAIDWSSAESGAGPADRALIDELKLLATLSEVHRGRSTIGSIGTVTSSSQPEKNGGGAEGEHWGHLRLLEPIGRGAFGDVYRAWDARLDREVALKLLPAGPASGNGAASSIIHEGRLLARVRHPNVVTIHGADQIGDRIGLWMELVQGLTLEQILEERAPLSAAETVSIGVEVCRAVSAVHRAGLLHRDIKAHNVMRAAEGRIVLMDFGTGRELDDEASDDLTGTPLYLAPEVLQAQPATVSSDVYSLGVLLYHLLTGTYPIHARSVREIRRAHERGERTPVRAARQDVPVKLARVIERATNPDPEQRYESADALAAALAALGRPGLMRVAPVIGIAAALVLALGLLWEVVGRRMGSSSTPAILLGGVAGSNPFGVSEAAPFEQPIIAVLPFKNLSAELDSDYFVDGLTDEIIRNLAVIQGLQVRSSTSSFAFKDAPRNLQVVGAQLGANLVVEGSVMRSGTKLRINASLVPVASDVPLWSERFDRELKDVFAIQDEISRAVVNKLRLTLGRGQRRYDTNVAAYDLYLKGLALIARRGVPNAEKAAELFEQVLARDSAFAPGYAGLAYAYALMATPTSSVYPFEVAYSRMRPAALKALELDPLLAEAHTAIGLVYSFERDWTNAERAFRQAMQLNPSLTQSYTNYSVSTLQPLGKFDEALRILRVALQNDPLSLEVQEEMGTAQLYAGRYTEAISTLQRVVAIDPEFPFAKLFLARALTFEGRLTEAIPLLEEIDGRHLGRFKAPLTRRTPWLAQPYVMTGKRAEAEMLAVEHEASASSLAVIYAALGDKDRAFEALERVAVVEPHHVGRILLQPEIAGLRGDPRLAILRERFNLPTP